MSPTKTFQTIFISALLIITLTSCKEEKVVEYNDDEIIVLIESPSYASNFFLGEPITFVGSAGTDNGYLMGEDLVWTSSIDGVIGYGDTFSRDDLSEGSHEITLTVANEAGESFQNSVPMNVLKHSRQVRQKIKEKRNIQTVVDFVDNGIYIDADDGTIIDMTTGLMWEKTPDNYKRDYFAAIEYANNLNLGGYDDWRMPTIEELLVISNLYLNERQRKNLNLSKKAFLTNGTICKVFDTMSGHFWAFQRPYTKNGKTLAANSVKYRYKDLVTSLFSSAPAVYEVNNPGFVRCVRKSDLKKWNKVLSTIKK